MKKVLGIIAALPQELKEFQTKLQAQKIHRRNSEEFFEGEFYGYPVVLTLSGCGKVNAALTTQRLISEFNVEKIIFTGVGGGINSNLNIGDIVVAEKTFHHDYGWLSDEFKLRALGNFPELGMGTGKEDLYFRYAGEQFCLQECIKNLNPVTIHEKKYSPQLIWGTVATGDQFIGQRKKKEELERLGADVVEMEGAAVAQVAQKNCIPFLIIRAISDKADGEAPENFLKFLNEVAHNNEEVAAYLVKNNLF